MFIKVKNRESKEVVIIDEAALGQGFGFFPKDKLGDTRPYITLVMQLGVQTKTSKDALSANIPPKPTKMKVPKTQTPLKITSQQRQPHHTSSPHPRYPIYITRCSNAVYKVIQSNDSYVSLVGQDILDEHPRQYPSALAAVRRFKPDWNSGPDYHDWVESEELQRSKPENISGDHVFVGADAVSSKANEDEDSDSDVQMGDSEEGNTFH